MILDRKKSTSIEFDAPIGSIDKNRDNQERDEPVESEVIEQNPVSQTGLEDHAGGNNQQEQEKQAREKSEAILRSVESASSLEELTRIITEAGIVYGQANPNGKPRPDGKTGEDGLQRKSDEVVEKINSFRDFVEENCKSLLVSVIISRKDSLNNKLSKFRDDLPVSFGIQRKAKELIDKEVWDKYFKENKREVVESSILNVQNLPELYSFIGSFKVIQADEKRYDPEKVIVHIQKVDGAISNWAKDNDLTKSENISKLKNKLVVPCLIHLPGHTAGSLGNEASGQDLIFRTVRTLLLRKIDDLRLKQKSDSLSEPRGARKFFGRVRGFFSRRK